MPVRLKAVGMFSHTFNFCSIAYDLEASSSADKVHHGTQNSCPPRGLLGVNFCLHQAQPFMF